MKNPRASAYLFLALILISACSSSPSDPGDDGGPEAGVVATVMISPTSTSVGNGFEQPFTVMVVDEGGSPVGATRTWSVSSSTVGSINSSGLFTAGVTTPAAGLVIVSAGGIADTATVTITAQTISYSTDLLPTFQGTCAQSGCHAAGSAPSGLVLSDYNSMRAGGGNGDPISSGNPAGSIIIQKLSSTNTPAPFNQATPFGSQMPLSGSVTLSWKHRLYVWIQQGAANNAPPPR